MRVVVVVVMGGRGQSVEFRRVEQEMYMYGVGVDIVRRGFLQNCTSLVTSLGKRSRAYIYMCKSCALLSKKHPRGYSCVHI